MEMITPWRTASERIKEITFGGIGMIVLMVLPFVAIFAFMRGALWAHSERFAVCERLHGLCC
jgi:hypothetical protein